VSYKATNWAWELGLKMPEKFVLVALADMADEKQSCYPGQATLSRMTGASESTVRRALNRLEDGGLLVREERRTNGGYRTSDRYVLQVGATLDNYRSDCPVGAQPTGHADQPHRSHRPTSPVTVTGTYKEEPLENHQSESPVLLSPDESVDGTLIPDGWRPNQGHIDKAAALHLDVRAEYQRFREHAARKHRRLKNWNAGFTNWLRKQAEFRQEQQGTRAGSVSSYEQGAQVHDILAARQQRAVTA